MSCDPNLNVHPIHHCVFLSPVVSSAATVSAGSYSMPRVSANHYGKRTKPGSQISIFVSTLRTKHNWYCAIAKFRIWSEVRGAVLVCSLLCYLLVIAVVMAQIDEALY